ncbi:hypothetical protein TNCV_55811 [Trichonephila clavipes]|nr:hypothetical protein TNCV_55811 [Trichonephila clavipes]
MPDHRTFQGLYRQLREICSFHVTRHNACQRRDVRNQSLEGSILNVVAVRPESSTRAHHVKPIINTRDNSIRLYGREVIGSDHPFPIRMVSLRVNRFAKARSIWAKERELE